MQCSPRFQSGHPSPLPRLPCLRAIGYVCPGAWWGCAHFAARGRSLQGQEHAATGRRRLPAAALPCTEEHARPLLRPEPHCQGAGASSGRNEMHSTKPQGCYNSVCARQAALHALFIECRRAGVQAPVQSQERLPKRTASAACPAEANTLVPLPWVTSFGAGACTVRQAGQDLAAHVPLEGLQVCCKFMVASKGFLASQALRIGCLCTEAGRSGTRSPQK